MNRLTLISSRNYPLQSLVEGALENELRILEVGIRRTRKNIEAFEEKYAMTSDKFVQRFENDELEETMELIEWIGECRLLQRLQEKADTLREIQFAH